MGGVRAGMAVTVRTDYGRVWDARVAHVQKRMLKGAYNPYTLSGTIFVNNVAISTHSSWFLEGWVNDPPSSLKGWVGGEPPSLEGWVNGDPSALERWVNGDPP